MEKEKEKTRQALSLRETESELVLSITIGLDPTKPAVFYDGFLIRGIRILDIQPGSLSCTFIVPPRLTDLSGNLSPGAIAYLVDVLGGTAIYAEGLSSQTPTPLRFSVDMSISYMSSAKVNDELEITSKVLGHKGGYSGSYVLVRNKTTGEVVAEGRQSVFGTLRSKGSEEKRFKPQGRKGG